MYSKKDGANSTLPAYMQTSTQVAPSLTYIYMYTCPGPTSGVPRCTIRPRVTQVICIRERVPAMQLRQGVPSCRATQVVHKMHMDATAAGSQAV